MLKLSIILNSSVTMLIIVLNFGFKIYLAKEFSQENLVIYYTITDIFSIIGRVFIGYKDALTTIYNQTKHKLKILRTWSVFFIWVVLFSSFIIIPLSFNFYLVEKIPNLTIQWWYISLLFVSINFVSFYGYLFLVTKYYKLISINDILKSIFGILSILFLYLFIKLDADYKTLIVASIISNLLILIFLIYKQIKYLPRYGIIKLLSIKFAKFKDNTNKNFVKLTIMASSNYFIYGLLLFAPIFTMLNYGTTDELAEFQVVARSIYFALISAFSWPLARFMFPEFSSLIAKKNYTKLNIIRNKFIKLLIIFGIVSIIGCWLLSKLIIGYLFPIEYLDSYKMINILIVALPFVMYQNFSESIIKAVGNYKINFIIKSSGIISFIFVYILFNLYFKIDLASIYAFVFGMISIFLLSFYFEMKIKKNWN
jgi:O-antigen/teichoic acid export membrane protein